MLFNTLTFFVFLPIVFILYWFVFNKSIKVQNVLLLIASYVFYGWWDYRFLSLIAFSTLVDYFIGLQIRNSSANNIKKQLLWLSLFVNIGLLGVFKYYNFFINSWVEAWGDLGIEISPSTISIILPVGISFYTFQTLSYAIDVYRGKLQPTNSLVVFASYVSFFPQLVAGPIERATNLLPQFLKPREFTYKSGVLGLRLILYGLFKKMVIADNLAPYVDDIFSNYSEYSGLILVGGAVFFAIQIYADFSGYSDIAIGTARLFGFKLMTNFKQPYFSRNIGEFWRRWHISLSTWFRDYVYIPLGGSRGSKPKQFRNVLIIFIVSGLWHGANWTFVLWGLFHALLFVPLLYLNQNRKYTDEIAKGRILPSINEFLAIITTFSLTTFAWIFFRSNSIANSFDYIKLMFLKIFELNFSTKLTYSQDVKPLLVICVFFMLIEWFSRDKVTFVNGLLTRNKPLRYSLYFVMLLLIITSFSNDNTSFIYFQF